MSELRRRSDRIASTQMRLLVTALKRIRCPASCGASFFIAAATEGFPFTSIIRDEFWQDAIGGLGLFLALLGVCLGFAVGKTKIAPMGERYQTTGARDDAYQTCPRKSSSSANG